MRCLAGWRAGIRSCRGGSSFRGEGPALGRSPSRWITCTFPPLPKATPTPSILQSKEGKSFPAPPVQPGAPTLVWVSLDQKGLEKGGCSPDAARVFVPRRAPCPKATASLSRAPGSTAGGQRGLQTRLGKGAHDLANGHRHVAFP